LDESFTSSFFFAQKTNEREAKLHSVINELYFQIKKDQKENPNIVEKLRKVGKDLTAQKLCSILNFNINEVMEMDLSLARRHLYASHVENANQIWNAQNRK
jgi:hypothetical protein